jgi:hypothetical protein
LFELLVPAKLFRVFFTHWIGVIWKRLSLKVRLWFSEIDDLHTDILAAVFDENLLPRYVLQVRFPIGIFSASLKEILWTPEIINARSNPTSTIAIYQNAPSFGWMIKQSGFEVLLSSSRWLDHDQNQPLISTTGPQVTLSGSWFERTVLWTKISADRLVSNHANSAFRGRLLKRRHLWLRAYRVDLNIMSLINGTVQMNSIKLISSINFMLCAFKSLLAKCFVYFSGGQIINSACFETPSYVLIFLSPFGINACGKDSMVILKNWNFTYNRRYKVTMYEHRINDLRLTPGSSNKETGKKIFSFHWTNQYEFRIFKSWPTTPILFQPYSWGHRSFGRSWTLSYQNRCPYGTNDNWSNALNPLKSKQWH